MKNKQNAISIQQNSKTIASVVETKQNLEQFK